MGDIGLVLDTHNNAGLTGESDICNGQA